MKKRMYRGHLRLADRQVIHLMRAKGKVFAEIARAVDRDRSVVWRELKRNKAPAVISRQLDALEKAKYADDKAKVRRSDSKRGVKGALKLAKVRIQVEECLRENRDSPEVIAMRLAAMYGEAVISGKSIRRWLSKEAKYLREFLPERGKKRRNRVTRRKLRFANAKSIHQRPKMTQLGDFEADAIVCSSSKDAIISVRERVSPKGWFEKVENLKADTVRRALITIFRDIPAEVRTSCTFDNGTEFASFEALEKLYGIQTYFCDPYAAWQKGSVENLNKALRVFIPKKTNLASVSTEELSRLQKIINNKPMKCLNARTPNQIWEQQLAKL